MEHHNRVGRDERIRGLAAQYQTRSSRARQHETVSAPFAALIYINYGAELLIPSASRSSMPRTARICAAFFVRYSLPV